MVRSMFVWVACLVSLSLPVSGILIGCGHSGNSLGPDASTSDGGVASNVVGADGGKTRRRGTKQMRASATVASPASRAVPDPRERSSSARRRCPSWASRTTIRSSTSRLLRTRSSPSRPSAARQPRLARPRARWRSRARQSSTGRVSTRTGRLARGSRCGRRRTVRNRSPLRRSSGRQTPAPTDRAFSTSTTRPLRPPISSWRAPTEQARRSWRRAFSGRKTACPRSSSSEPPPCSAIAPRHHPPPGDPRPSALSRSSSVRAERARCSRRPPCCRSRLRGPASSSTTRGGSSWRMPRAAPRRSSMLPARPPRSRRTGQPSST